MTELAQVQGHEVEEDYQARLDQGRSTARWFVGKLIKRVGRISKGEKLGPMVDSELESLQVDQVFENRRKQIEAAPSPQIGASGNVGQSLSSIEPPGG